MGRKLKNGQIQSQKYGRLIVLKELPRFFDACGKPRRKFLCKCDCGNETEVALNALTRTLSCGCLRSEMVSERATIHGLRKHTLYNVWDGMKQRCGNPHTARYRHYGGRGIKVCEEWKNDFKVFYDWAMANGWKKGLQIDRIENDGNYEPFNCQFISNKENNRKKDNNKITGEIALEIRANYNGVQTHLQIAQKYNVCRAVIASILSNRSWV